MSTAREKTGTSLWALLAFLIGLCFFIAIASIGWRVEHVQNELYTRSVLLDTVLLCERKKADLAVLHAQYSGVLKDGGELPNAYDLWNVDELYAKLNELNASGVMSKVKEYKQQLDAVNMLYLSEQYDEARELYFSAEYEEARSSLTNDFTAVVEYLQVHMKEQIDTKGYDIFLLIAILLFAGLMIFAMR